MPADSVSGENQLPHGWLLFHKKEGQGKGTWVVY